MNGEERRVPFFLNSQKSRGAERSTEQQWPHINEEIALRKSLSTTKMKRTIRTLIYTIKCKCERRGEESSSQAGGRTRMRPHVQSMGYS
jgi:hypothetical protein